MTSGVGRVENRIFTNILKRARPLAILASYFLHEISVEVGYYNPPYLGGDSCRDTSENCRPTVPSTTG